MNKRAEASTAFWGDADDSEARQRLRTLVDAIDDGLFHLDETAHVVGVNDVLTELTGYERDELLGEHVTDLFDETNGGAIEREFDRLRADPSEEGALLELALRTGDGEPIPCELRTSALESAGDRQGTVGVLRPLTDGERGTSHAAFLDDLTQTLQSHTAPAEIASTATRLLGEYLAVDRCVYAEVADAGTDGHHHSVATDAGDGAGDVGDGRGDANDGAGDADDFSTVGEYTSGDSASVDDERAVPGHGDETLDRLQNDEPVVVEGGETDGVDQRRAATDGERADGTDGESLVLAPLHEDGTLTAVMAVQQRTPRTWDAHEVDLLDTVAHRCRRALARARTIRELRERAQHLSALVEATPECIKTVADDGTLVQMNPAGLEMVQAEAASDVLGESVYDLIAPEDRERFEAFNERICRGERGILEFDIVGLAGDRRHMESHAAPLSSPDGTTSHVALTRDVTERTERERELERALDLLEKTERIADVGGWELDPQTQDVFWTEHLFDLLEVEVEEEPPFDEALEVYHEDDRSTVEDAIQRAIDSREPFDVEVRFRTPSGEVRWLRLQGAPETVDGEVTSLRGAAQDVSERREYERKLEESNERLEQFAYAASHDLQEPLRMVSSYLQLIERRYAEELDEDAREFLEFAVDGAERMRDMIDGLLNYSRVETRGDPFEPVDLDAVFADVSNDLQVMIEESDAAVSAESLPTVHGDRGQLRQVFQNLLDNAIEYSGDEPPEIHVSAERSGDEWVISVRDEGIGIDPDDADRVFEVFQSLHTPDEHSGTGIGLALCERIVERHGGDIWVDADAGEGTTFSFTLPVDGEPRE